MSYQVILPNSVQKELERLPQQTASRILEALDGLQINPRPSGCKKLQGIKAWRVRIGDYRIIYEIHDKVLRVIVISIGHRSDVYR